MEHKVLEYFYPQFLKKNQKEPVSHFLKEYDAEFASKVKENKVGWDSAWYQGMLWAMSDQVLFESRVKSTLITSYKLKDLLLRGVAAAWTRAGRAFAAAVRGSQNGAVEDATRPRSELLEELRSLREQLRGQQNREPQTREPQTRLPDSEIAAQS